MDVVVSWCKSHLAVSLNHSMKLEHPTVRFLPEQNQGDIEEKLIKISSGKYTEYDLWLDFR